MRCVLHQFYTNCKQTAHLKSISELHSTRGSAVKWNATIVTSFSSDIFSTKHKDIRTHLAICTVPLCGIRVLRVVLKQSVVEPLVHGLCLITFAVKVGKTLSSVLFGSPVFQLASPIGRIYGAIHFKMRAELETQTFDDRRIQLRTDDTNNIRIENKALTLSLQRLRRGMH